MSLETNKADTDGPGTGDHDTETSTGDQDTETSTEGQDTKDQDTETSTEGQSNLDDSVGHDTTTPAADFPTGEAPSTEPDHQPILALSMLAALLLSLAAAAHLVATRERLNIWKTEAFFVSLTGMVQFAIALLIARRPARRSLVLGVLGALLPASAWALTRFSGYPFGPLEATKAPVHFFDVAVTVVESMAAYCALMALASRRRIEHSSVQHLHASSSRAALATLWLAALVGSAALFSSVSASAAGPGTGGGHDHSTSGGHDHSATAATNAGLTSDQRKVLGEQLTQAREVALQYPTVKDALDAGLVRAGPYSAGAGAHYFRLDDAVQDSFDIDRPASWLYSGNQPDSVVVGLMYYLTGDTAPEGFAGPGDEWHQHGGACYSFDEDGQIDVPLPVDQDVTKEQCHAIPGANFIDRTGWMVHVWAVPGWESPTGVFAHNHTELLCPDGAAEVANLATGCEG